MVGVELDSVQIPILVSSGIPSCRLTLAQSWLYLLRSLELDASAIFLFFHLRGSAFLF